MGTKISTRAKYSVTGMTKNSTRTKYSEQEQSRELAELMNTADDVNIVKKEFKDMVIKALYGEENQLDDIREALKGIRKALQGIKDDDFINDYISRIETARTFPIVVKVRSKYATTLRTGVSTLTAGFQLRL